MKLEDFRLADCTLFRTPPLDTSIVSETIDEILLNAWQKGTSAQDAFNKVLSNKEVSKALKEKIASHLEYQRQVALSTLQEKKQEMRAQSTQEYEQQRAEVESQYGEKVAMSAEQLAAAERAKRAKEHEYTAASYQLSQLRNRVASQLEKMGGAQGLERLISLNKKLLGQASFPSPPADAIQRPEQPSYPSSETQPSITIIYPEDESPLSEHKQSERTRAQKEREPFLKKLWRILNYRIW